MEYQSLRVKGSTVFFLRPFLPLERRLFLPAVSGPDGDCKSQWHRPWEIRRVNLTFRQPCWAFLEVSGNGWWLLSSCFGKGAVGGSRNLNQEKSVSIFGHSKIVCAGWGWGPATNPSLAWLGAS